MKQDWKKSHNKSIIIGAVAGFGIMVFMAVLVFATMEYAFAPSKQHDQTEEEWLKKEESL
jgi:hypothetical protein